MAYCVETVLMCNIFNWVQYDNYQLVKHHIASQINCKPYQIRLSLDTAMWSLSFRWMESKYVSVQLLLSRYWCCWRVMYYYCCCCCDNDNDNNVDIDNDNDKDNVIDNVTVAFVLGLAGPWKTWLVSQVTVRRSE